MLHSIGKDGEYVFHKGYTYTALRPASMMTFKARARLVASTICHEKGPEPILHLGSTHEQKEDKATRRAFLQENKDRRPTYDTVKAKLQDERAKGGKPVELTTEEAALVQQYTSERKEQASRIRLARRYQAHESEAMIVGAAKVRNFEAMYLVHYTEREWENDPKVRLWVCEDALGSFDSITKSYAIERIQVWWTAGGKSAISSK